MDDAARFGTASVAQVAALLDQTEDEVLASALLEHGDSAARRGWLTAEAVTSLVSTVSPARPLTEAKSLILRAFSQARERGSSNWTSMSVPVLKNRLLQLSSQQFRESDYASPSIWHFVTRFADILTFEGERPGERVRLTAPEEVAQESAVGPAELDPAGMGRIRPDLWRALFDYSSQARFVWDERTGRARMRGEQDPPTVLELPTLSPDDLAELRAEFAGVQQDVSAHDAQRLEEWVRRGGPTIALPRLYRGLWNAHLKSHAANKLRAFFLGHNMDVPDDLLLSVSAPTDHDHEVERLRKFAHQCIDAMSAEELSRVSFEMGVLSRVSPRLVK